MFSAAKATIVAEAAKEGIVFAAQIDVQSFEDMADALQARHDEPHATSSWRASFPKPKLPPRRRKKGRTKH